MIKTFSVLTLAGMVALPTVASAGGGNVPTDIFNSEIEELARQVDALQEELARKDEIISGMVSEVTSENNKKNSFMSKKMDSMSEEMSSMSEELEDMESKLDDLNDMDDMLEEKSDPWDIDLTERFNFFGDFRSRLDYYSATGSNYINSATGLLVSGREYSNDTLFTNRLRLNMKVNVTEDVQFKGRVSMYKAWGMESYPRNDMNTWWPQFDGNSTRTPSDNALRVDRAYVNWNNIGGAPVWFSVGRRPSTDGIPAQIRLGTDKRMATPTSYMDYSFDGATIGYAYDWNNEKFGSGRIRYCFGRGFENGVQWKENKNILPLDDTEFTGFSWDVMQTEDRLLYIQSYVAFNMFMRPSFQDNTLNETINRTDGNLYHTSAVYQAQTNNFNYFISGGWSKTDPDGEGMFNDYDATIQNNGIAVPNPQWRPNTESENGFSLYAGVRYDVPDTELKIGAEYNYGSKYWVAFTPGHDDMYLSKLAARGQVAELYMIYDLPTGKAVSKYAKTFIRLGYQHYWYDYTGSDWNTKPYDTDDALTMTALMAENGQMPIDSADQIYLTLDVYF